MNTESALKRHRIGRTILVLNLKSADVLTFKNHRQLKRQRTAVKTVSIDAGLI